MMNKEKHYSPEEMHQRQTWLEILLPLLVALLVCAGAIVLVILAAAHGNSSIAQWSAISIILMIIPTFFVCLVAIALVFVLDRLLIKGNRKLPVYTQNIRQKAELITSKIQQALLGIVSFFMNIESFFASIKRFFSVSKSPKE